MRPLAAALCTTLVLAACDCGQRPAERVFEVGAALQDLPAVGASRNLAALVPGRPAALLLTPDPPRALRLLEQNPRLKALFAAPLLAELALSDAGATGRALSQRLNELSQLPLPAPDLYALLDGPLVVAVRLAPPLPAPPPAADEAAPAPKPEKRAARPGAEVLVLKRLSPAQAESWRLAQMLQAVHPTLAEVRVERYRGLPLRKVVLGTDGRLGYFLLRDVLVASTSDGWLKESLDLALGGAAQNALDQPALARALAESRSAAGALALDVAALRTGGRAGLLELALAQLDWVSVRLGDDGRALVAAAPAAAAAPDALPPSAGALGLCRSLDWARLAKGWGAAPGEAARSDAAAALAATLGRELLPALGASACYAFGGFARDDDGALRARHVLAISLKDASLAQRLPTLAAALLVEPLPTRFGAHAGYCSDTDPELCLAVVKGALLAGNGEDALEQAVMALDARPPAPGPGNVAWLDGAWLSTAVSTAFATDEEHGKPRADALVAALAAVGPAQLALAPEGTVLRGEVKAR